MNTSWAIFFTHFFKCQLWTSRHQAQEFVMFFVFILSQNICQTGKKNGHLLTIFQRSRQLNQAISEEAFKAKVFCIFTKNLFLQTASFFEKRKLQFLAA